MAKKDTVAFAFGRFNPPSVGHLKLINKVASVARQQKADYLIYPTKSEDPAKNPLSFPQKVHFMRKLFPKHSAHISSDAGVRTLIQAMQKFETDGYRNVVLVGGSDRISEFDKLLQSRNGKDYTFDSVKVVSAGDRDPDAPGVKGMSASKMRAAAAKNDFSLFLKGVSLPKQGKALFDATRKGMHITEFFINNSEVIGSLAEQLSEGADASVLGTRFNQLLRFGLQGPDAGMIPQTKRAFADFHKAGSNPILRNLIFDTTDSVFEFILNDDLLFNRFLTLLHRREVFGEETTQRTTTEGNSIMHFDALKSKIKAAGRQLGKQEITEKMINYVAGFPAPEDCTAFKAALQEAKNAKVTWGSKDLREIQFNLTSPVQRIHLEELASQHNGTINIFDGDVREGWDAPAELIESLLNKAYKAELSYDLLSRVYIRGLNSYLDECTTPETTTEDQYAYARVNSFIAGGKARKTDDQDIWIEQCERIEEIKDTELDAAFITELKLLGKLAVAGVGYALVKGRANKKKAEDERKHQSKGTKPAKAGKYKNGWRNKVDFTKNEEFVNEDFELFIAEEYGAGPMAEVNNSGTLAVLKERFQAKKAIADEEDTQAAKENRRATLQLEEAPPSAKAERFIKNNKTVFQDRYGSEGKAILYKTAWDLHNKHWKKEGK